MTTMRADKRTAVSAFCLLALACGLPNSVAQVPTPARIAVTGYTVTGNTLLPAQRIDEVLSTLIGDRSPEDLNRAASQVQALYARAGYGAVVAFVPEQSLRGGTVEIRVIEGQLAQVDVEGNSRFTSTNITNSLPALKVGRTPNLRELDAQIQLANDNPSKQVQVLLQPGQHTGEARAKVTVVEESPLRWWIGADNTGTERTGRLRAEAGAQHANLFDLDHVLSAQIQVSPDKLDAVKVLSAGYRIPFYASRMAFDAFAAYADVEGGTNSTLAGDLSFAGRGHLFGARMTRYLARLGEVDQRLTLGIDYRTYLNKCDVAGLPAGACGSADADVSVQPLILEYALRQGGSAPWSTTISIQHNLQLGGSRSDDSAFEAARAGAKPRYTLLRFAGSGSIPVVETWQLHGRLTLQYTDNALVSSEQFGIGGASSVRGYEERELSGDRGAALTLELQSPDFARAVSLTSGDLRAVAFADAGYVANRADLPCLETRQSCSLGSVGTGFRFNARNVKASLYVGSALKDASYTKRGDVRVHFSVSYSH